MAHYPLNHHLRQTYRFLAALAGLYLLLAGLIGLAATWGDPFFRHGGDWALGLRTNPAGAWVASVFGFAVVVAVLLGGNAHHHASVVLGWALMTVAMLQMTVIQTDANVLDTSMVNVIVEAVIGLVVLTAGLYGRVGGRAT